MADTSTAPPPVAAGRAAHPGIVACAVYRDGRRVHDDVPLNEIGLYARAEGSIVWLGLYEPNEDVLETLGDQLGLHTLLLEDAHQAHQRPKIEIYGDVLFLVLRTAQLINGEIEYGETHLIASRGFVVSIRHGASSSYAEVRRRCEQSPDLMRLGESHVVHAILDFIVDNYYPIVDDITGELALIEREIFSAAPANEKIERIYRLRAELVTMRRAVAALVEISNRLGRHELPVITAAIRPYLHDLHDHALQVDEAIVDLRERLASAFEASLLLASARQNEIVKRLAGWAAILAVPTAIAGIYGMNFKYMPELQWPWGYPALMALMGAACGYLFYRFKRAAWL
jgi:magnesium transporter